MNGYCGLITKNFFYLVAGNFGTLLEYQQPCLLNLSLSMSAVMPLMSISYLHIRPCPNIRDLVLLDKTARARVSPQVFNCCK